MTEIKEVEIKISTLVKHLFDGLSWLTKDDTGKGSIQAKIGATESEINEIKKHPVFGKLKRIKLVDDYTDKAVKKIAPEVVTESVASPVTDTSSNLEAIEQIIEKEQEAAIEKEKSNPLKPQFAEVEAKAAENPISAKMIEEDEKAEAAVISKMMKKEEDEVVQQVETSTATEDDGFPNWAQQESEGKQPKTLQVAIPKAPENFYPPVPESNPDIAAFEAESPRLKPETSDSLIDTTGVMTLAAPQNDEPMSDLFGGDFEM